VMRAMASSGDPLRGLPASFTRALARRAGLTDRELYRLRDGDMIEALGYGHFRRTDVGVSADPDLLEIAPRGQHRPATTAPVRWHLFDRESFDVGRTKMPLDETTSIGLYGPERSIIDAIRLRHQEGPELGYNALKRWLARPGAMPSDLLRLAAHFPATRKALREALEILL
jgi:hypothetical protein